MFIQRHAYKSSGRSLRQTFSAILSLRPHEHHLQDHLALEGARSAMIHRRHDAEEAVGDEQVAVLGSTSPIGTYGEHGQVLWLVRDRVRGLDHLALPALGHMVRRAAGDQRRSAVPRPDRAARARPCREPCGVCLLGGCAGGRAGRAARRGQRSARRPRRSAASAWTKELERAGFHSKPRSPRGSSSKYLPGLAARVGVRPGMIGGLRDHVSSHGVAVDLDLRMRRPRGLQLDEPVTVEPQIRWTSSAGPERLPAAGGARSWRHG